MKGYSKRDFRSLEDGISEVVPQTSVIGSVSLCNEYEVCKKINKQIKYL